MKKISFVIISLMVVMTSYAQESIDGSVTQSDAKVVFEKGMSYYLKNDYANAIVYIQKASDMGLPEAVTALGNCYEEGHGVLQDYSKAAECYRKAAEAGYALAQYNLALFYDSGCGVAQDYTQAAKWYQKAAEQGVRDAQTNLGIYYEKGVGVDVDCFKAVDCFKRQQTKMMLQHSIIWLYAMKSVVE